jgi:aryl-alcohol dehydrogenase-like predicted oxidoreductase
VNFWDRGNRGDKIAHGMEHRTLGRTGLKVSAIGFGTAPIGIANYLGSENRDDPAFQRQAIDAIRVAVDRGITYFDTAPSYGNTRSEQLLGVALENLRDRVVFGTKYGPDAHTSTYQQRTDALHASLDRLKTDHVELLQLHGGWWDDPCVEQLLKSDAMQWADEMRARGLAKFLGITAEGPSGGLERLLHAGRFDVLQIAYNVIYQSACDYQREPRGVIPLAKSLGMGVLSMRGPTSGTLQKILRTEFPEIDLKRVTRLAINFALSTPLVDCVIVGMKQPREVLENVALAEDVNNRIDLRKIHDRFDGTPLEGHS